MQNYIVPFLIAIAPLVAHADIVSTFDEDAQGWTAFPNGETEVSYIPSGGLPGGYLEVTDVGNAWGYVEAPDDFLVSGGYGGQLRFNLRAFTSDPDNYPLEFNVRVGLAGAGLTLIAESDAPPGTSWQSYVFELRETDNWRKFSNLDQNYNPNAPVPTAQEIIDVLGNLDGLYLSADYTNGTLLNGRIDRTSIDNVVLTAGSEADADADGVPDLVDNCTGIGNLSQRDTDGDGIGNACDADVAGPNDCFVNFSDLGVYKQNFFQAGDLDTDNDGDGLTNFVDLGIVKAYFFGAPGPSAAGCN